MLGGAELVEVSSDGEPGDKARFVRGVERALLNDEAEIGVHSAKDLPAEMPDGLTIAAVPAREDPADVWIGAGGSLDEVPNGARVGTASLRRRAQLLAARPDLRVSELHGNVDTRLRKLNEGELDAIVLAAAGLRRLGREGEASFSIPAERMTPAAGQGALVLQTRVDDEATIDKASALGDETALRELTAERAVVALLEATCATPIGVHARIAAGRLEIEAFVGLPDGSEWIRDRGEDEQPAVAGALLAERLVSAGARDILDRAETS
jgi:hydroxymethylbilane synthase